MNRAKEKNRKLSPAEEARNINFEKTKEELSHQGYEAKDLTVGLVYANIMAIVLTAPIIILLGALFIFCNVDTLLDSITMIGTNAIIRMVLFLILFFALIIVHELIHGITWSRFTKKGWKSISFGFILKYLTPYCTCDETLKKSQYIIGALMPTIVLGMIPAISAVISGSFFVFAIGALMILSGGGDLTIVLKLLLFKAHSKEVLYIDHPYQAGLVAFIR